MIGRAISKLARRIDLEQADFCATSCVAIADYDDCVFRNQHLVVPGGCRVDIRAKSINAGDWSQSAIIDCNGEEAAATQNNQVIAMQLDDGAFINAGMLHIGD